MKLPNNSGSLFWWYIIDLQLFLKTVCPNWSLIYSVHFGLLSLIYCFIIFTHNLVPCIVQTRDLQNTVLVLFQGRPLVWMLLQANWWPESGQNHSLYSECICHWTGKVSTIWMFDILIISSWTGSQIYVFCFHIKQFV